MPDRHRPALQLCCNITMRLVRCSLIQATNAAAPDSSLEVTKKAMMDKHVAYIEEAAKAGAQIVCLQEIFYGPYFCAEQATKWYDFTEPIPDGPTIRLMQDLAQSTARRADRPDLRNRAGRASTTTPRP